MSVHTIITEDLLMRNICAKLVPKVRIKPPSWSTTIWSLATSQSFPVSLVPIWPQWTFFLFSGVNRTLKECRHRTVIEFQTASTRCLKDTSEKTSRTHFKREKFVSRDVSTPKDPILKNVNYLYRYLQHMVFRISSFPLYIPSVSGGFIP